MKIILILLAIVTFTTCQYDVEVESQNLFKDIGEINDHEFQEIDIPEYIPVHIQYETPHSIPKYQNKIKETDENIRKPSVRKPKKNEDGDAYIIKYSNINNGFEGYLFGYETSNGISRNEELTFRDIDEDDQVADIKGGYQFTDPLGRKVVVKYTAGVDGFKPIIQYL